MYMDWHFLPVCRILFASHPPIESVVLSFALVDDRPTRVEDWILPCLEREPVWPPTDTAHDEWGDEADQVERAERELFAGGTWPAVGDHDLIVAFAAFCLDVDEPRKAGRTFLPYAIARREPEGLSMELTGSLRTAWWEDNFNVGRYRFRSSSPFGENGNPLKGISREALLATPNARFSYEYTRVMAEKLLSIARGELDDPDELEQIKDWVAQSRTFQRHIRGAR